MHIDIIDDFQTFQAIRENWDSVYAADPQAQFFLSWEWLSGWLQMVGEPWFILAAKPDSHDLYVAFLPLKFAITQEADNAFSIKLCMAGNSMADYTGILSLPEYEREVILLFSEYIQNKLNWSTFDLKNILETDRRIDLLLETFSDDDFAFRTIRINNPGEDVDNYISPFVSLGTDWDQYLRDNISSHGRQKIRGFLRKVENSDEFRITHVNADNLESHIEILLKFWKSKWGEQKREQCDVIMNYMRAILRHCFKNNCLYFPVLWKGDRPLGAIANFVDVRQKSMLVYVQGRDETFKSPPPGRILHADAIRYAIEHGFKVYDFLRGNEEYKYAFGAQERRITHIEVKDKNYQKKQIDVRTLPLALNLTVQAHRANQLTKAEQGYLQILAVQPNHPEALYGLGALMRQKGEYQTAENLWKKLLEVQPNSLKALFSLGNLYQIQGQLSQAIETYNQILALQPDAIAVYNNLGYALQQQGKWEDAIKFYQKALELQPDCIEAEVNQANALYAQGKLSVEKQAHYAALNNDLGCKCQQLGDLQTAVAYYQQSIAMRPDFAKAHYNLGLVLQAQGDVETAIACYRKTLEFQPDFKDAELQLNQLSSVNSYPVTQEHCKGVLSSPLDNVKLFESAIPSHEFDEMFQVFPESHFERLKREGFLFYQTTFWYPLDREPENIFEKVVRSLQPLANPSKSTIGVEWWFSVVMTNKTPQWLLPCHFDCNDLAEKDICKIKHPYPSSVLFLNSVPYGDLVITDQILTERGIHPTEPKDMRFIRPDQNLYAVFPGNLYHGVIGRMWLPAEAEKLRVAMAVNWWTEKPKAAYMRDSRDCMTVFRLDSGERILHQAKVRY